jgi:hypothetical protein
MALAASIASAAWLQVGSGTGPAKVTVDAASALGATVTVEVPGIQADSVAIDGAQYLKLSIPGAVSAGLDVGKPEVPSVPVLLARPTGSTVTLRILSIKTDTLDVPRVCPLQRPQKYGEQAGPVTVDNSFYASDVEYPSDRLSSPYTATWRDLDVVNVHVYPVTVRPAQHQVIVTSRIKFRVDFSGGSYPRTVASWMPPLYRRLIQNYDDLRLTTAEQEPTGTKCLVFCYDSFAANNSLDSLLSLMTKLGDSTEVVNVPESVPADADSIKEKIRERYFGQDSALHWVFLVGRHDQIPPKEHPDSCYSEYSDYWYSDLSQQSLGCDMYPEVGIARLSPDDNDDLSHQITKIRDYMLGTGAGDWLDTMTLVAASLPEAETAVRNVVLWQGSARFFQYSLDTIFGSDPERSNFDIQNGLEQGGRGVLIYVGHGLVEGNGWAPWDSLGECWTKTQIDPLLNRYTPVVFNLCCSQGEVHYGKCLSEEWMSKHDTDSIGRGAVASYAAYAGDDTAGPNRRCLVAVQALEDYDTLRPPGQREYTRPVFDLGGIQMLMDADIATQLPNDSGDIYSFYWLGNPAMQVWSGGTPETATVTYPLHIPTGGPQPFMVTVTIGGQSVEGAQVCAYKPNDFYVVGSTGPGGITTLTLTASTPGPFYVSASKGHAKLSDTTTLQHTPMLPYCGTSAVDLVSPPSPTPDMTKPNWSRKLIREPGTGYLHGVYADGNSVCYIQSTDAGASWSTPDPIGTGTCPAIDMPDAAAGPWVVFLNSDSCIMLAKRDSGTWAISTVFQSSRQFGPTHIVAGAPSMAADVSLIPLANAGVTYPVYVNSPANSSYICYKFITQFDTSQTEVVDGPRVENCYGASIAVTPGNAAHVGWMRGTSAFYRQKNQYGVWSMPTQISSPTGTIRHRAGLKSVRGSLR